MNTPSVKTLSEVFGENAKLAKFFLTCTRAELLDTSIAAERLQRQSYLAHYTNCLRMIACDDLGDFHGVESCVTCDGEYLSYLNAGDTYICTLILWRGRFYVRSLGAMVESLEKKGIRFS